MRRLYNLPPTDPRFLELTDEQIDLEWEHYLLDHPEILANEHYTDPEYDEWEKKAIAEDERLLISDMRSGFAEELGKANKKGVLDYQKYDDWEEVEID